MASPLSFNARLKACSPRISPAERRVARFFQENREEVLIASASALAEQTSTSDATVVRTAKALGFAGMEELRRTLANEVREDLSPARRMARTLAAVGNDPDMALEATLDIHQAAIEGLRCDIAPERFRNAVRSIAGARRIFIFGIGPSSAMAEYFTVQLARFGIDARSLTDTGLLLADGLQKLARDDLVMIFAYSRVTSELTVMLDRAALCGAASILFSDTLGEDLSARVDMVLPVARGRSDMLSMHTATLALIEALLVGVATARPQETLAHLETLNMLRAALAGKDMKLPTAKAGR